MAKVIKLLSLVLTNFKGIQHFALDSNGCSINVFGDNAAGKTTLFDAFSYLLFDKDSTGAGQPEKWIKTLDSDGNVIHRLEHKVEGLIDVNGQRIALKKIFYEKWTRPRGTTEEVLSSHTTDYYFDGSNLKQGDYKKEIASIIDEELFKLLTNPSFFNEQYDKVKRRKVLFEIFGDITDDDVITLNPKLSIVRQILNGRIVDKAIEDIKKEQKRVDDEMKSIPVQIKEQQNTIFGTSTKKMDDLNSKLIELRNVVILKESELSSIQSGGEIAVKQQRKLELQNEQLQLKNELQAVKSGDSDKLRERLSKLKNRHAEVESINRNLETQASDSTTRILTLDRLRGSLRAEREQVKAQQFEQQHMESTCPTCNQSLPEEQIEAAHKSLLEQFNLNRSKYIEDITTRGKEAMHESNELAAKVEQIKAVIFSNEEGLHKLSEEIVKVQQALEDQSSSTINYEKDGRYQAFQLAISDMDEEITALRSTGVAKLESVRTELAQLRSEVEQLERDKASLEVGERARQRIEELKASEKVLARQYEEHAYHLDLLTEFIRTKAELLESKVNTKFDNVRFKLFETQVNGGMKDTCETLYGPNLVPYDFGLNRAAQCNSGLEIINVLSEHYQVVAPIFIDNAEAVTRPASTTGQQIKLTVSERDKWLWHEGSSIDRSPEIIEPFHQWDKQSEIENSNEQIKQDELF